MSSRSALSLVIVCTALLAGCAHLEFSDSDTSASKEGYVPFTVQRPYLLVNTDADCKRTGTLVVMDDLEHVHFVKPISGYGNSNLTANFSGGSITSFGQQNDNTSLPQSIASLATLAGIPAAKPAAGKNVVTSQQNPGKPCEGPAVEVYGFAPFHKVDMPSLALSSIATQSPENNDDHGGSNHTPQNPPGSSGNHHK